MSRYEPDPGSLKPGDVLAGKYRVERILGQGGMGIVVAAHHLQLDEKVALKFLLPQANRSPEAITRFTREARAAVKIKSEHVARVIDVGQLEGGSPYMVMEYLEGGDLAAWLKQRGPMPTQQAVGFLLQACEALADAHALGIVHRDLKPANLFCIQRSDGQLSIKVLDFGISKVTTPGAPGHDMTRTSALMGSPLYMSPEQMQMSKGVDARTDIWSLGIILFELVTGHPPFNAEAVTELAIKVANEPAPSLRSFLQDAPPGLEEVVATCLQKDRTRRYQTVGELAIALKVFAPKGARASVERVLGTLRVAGLSAAVLPASGMHPVVVAPGLGAGGARVIVSAGPPASVALAPAAPGTAASWGQTESRKQSGGRAVVGITAAAVVAVAAVAGTLILRRSSTPPSPPSVATAGPAASTMVPPPSSADPSPASVSALPPVPTAIQPATSTATVPIVKPGPRPSAPIRPAPAPSGSAAPPAPKPNCNPNYTFDADGNMHFKPECFQH